MVIAKCLLGTGKFNSIKRLAESDTKTIVEVVTHEGTQLIKNIKLGHRSSAKRVSGAEKTNDQHETWLPRVEVNGELVFIKDQNVPEGVASFKTRYLALNFARRFLAQKHKNAI
ncbi:hypothetical protein PP175_05795 [Aneurinibacillus sp. Ricciae_BoGa-3]|uniref:hypothetical protein n=1 Tax=Aneurinibacillus sp. Ricciae_BoGa-3 TaxID=3022697 RepID=UPI0023403975|nr:hypothetical protein [Aneurinibacillus sp. Ricciae_BoGa-3]WCK55461.1 hypothetical protein PP175_05795 [Aneurinibacillus sp. Ricciae_BoGa-3]